MGVGQTMEYALAHPDDAPRAGDVRSPSRLRRRLQAVHDRLTSMYGPLGGPPVAAVADVFTAFGRAVTLVDNSVYPQVLAKGICVFEGAQGVLLDEWRGWHPYTTWSTTTFANVEALCSAFERLGVVRTYTTRHGAGPFVTAADLPIPEAHNGIGEWQGAFRVGHFDAVAHRYAVEVCGGVDALAVTHLDIPSSVPELRICPEYEVDGLPWRRIVPGPERDLAYQTALTQLLEDARPSGLYRPDDWEGEISALLGAPIALASYGPRTSDKVTYATV
jgi:adenylosuccinate synthase